MHPLVWIGMLLGGLAFWRRKKLKSDSERVKATASGAKTAATEKIASMRGGDSASPATDDEATDDEEPKASDDGASDDGASDDAGSDDGASDDAAAEETSE